MPVTDNLLLGPDTMNAPWGLESRLRLVVLACNFFNIANIAKLADSRDSMPHTVSDFLKYLEVEKAFPRPPNAFRVARIVEQMVSAGLLVRTARGNSSIWELQDHYLSMVTIEDARRESFLLVPVLGPEYLYRLCAPSLVHITGRNDGVPVAGTGLVVDASHILTCRHVVSDMKIERRQDFQGKEYGDQRHPPTRRD